MCLIFLYLFYGYTILLEQLLLYRFALVHYCTIALLFVHWSISHICKCWLYGDNCNSYTVELVAVVMSLLVYKYG